MPPAADVAPGISPSVPNAFPLVSGQARRQRAFTLVELLVTMVVGLLLVVFLFQLFNATVGAWRSGENQNDTFREARAALQLMVRDISQTTAPLPRNAFASPTPSSAGGIAPVLVIDRYPNAQPAPQAGDEINEELYCLTHLPNNGSSSLCAVGYFCVWMPDLKTTNAPSAYALYRQFLGSGSPTAPGLFERFSKAPSRTLLTFQDLYERTPPPGVPDITNPVATASEVCSYIWDLQFRTTTTLQDPSPPRVIYGAAPIPPMPLYQGVLPAYVEVRFKALSAGAARQLEGNTGVTRATWNDTSASSNSIYKKIILPGTRQFVARVPIYSGIATPTPTP